jgi:hypothetical protein
MNHRTAKGIAATLVSLTLFLAPVTGMAQETQSDDGGFVLGSVLLSILHVPLKLATCIGTQATAAVAYTSTYGVPGHYDGGTNGRDIGETARRSCTGDWFISPQQVKKDYGN